MGRLERVLVSYHQFQVVAGVDGRGGHLDLYVVGDGLVHLTGRSELTVMAGPHTDWVDVGVEVLADPAGPDPDEWDAVSEATLWCPDGRITVRGLMGECPDQFRDIRVGRAGLIRVRVRARDRRPEHAPAVPDRPERHEVLVWPVDEDTGHVTLRMDDLPGSDWAGKPGRAATWALMRLAALANPDPREANLRRHAARRAGAGDDPRAAEAGRVESTATTVRRSRVVPAGTAAEVLRDPAGRLGLAVDGDALMLPVGDLAVRLIPDRPGDGSTFTAQWRWAAAAGAGGNVPDPRASRVEISADNTADNAGETVRLAVTHRGVAAPHAVLLGLVWEYLLHRAAAGEAAPHPWIEVFQAAAAEAVARAEAARRSRERYEARRWGGKPPSERLRNLAANTISLARMDRPLLDVLAEAEPQVQRAVARWATRQACAVAGLAGIDWVAGALAALDRDEPLPSPFDDTERAWQRLWSDPRIPQTVVTTPDGTPNFSQQALAFPTITQATNADPLAAAVDALAAAMYAHGPAYREVAAACRAAFPVLDRPATGRAGYEHDGS